MSNFDIFFLIKNVGGRLFYSAVVWLLKFPEDATTPIFGSAIQGSVINTETDTEIIEEAVEGASAGETDV